MEASTNSFQREDYAPQKKKKKSGRVSPRLLFGCLNEESVPSTSNSQPRRDVTPGKNSSWRPPLKLNTSLNEHLSCNYTPSDTSDCFIVQSAQRVTLTSNSENQEKQINKYALNVNQSFSTLEEQMGEDSYNNNEQENNTTTNLNISRSSESKEGINFDIEQTSNKSLETSYIDYCVERALSENVEEESNMIKSQKEIDNSIANITDDLIKKKNSSNNTFNETCNENVIEEINQSFEDNDKTTDHNFNTQSQKYLNLNQEIPKHSQKAMTITPPHILTEEIQHYSKSSNKTNKESENTMNIIEEEEFDKHVIDICEDNQDIFFQEPTQEINGNIKINKTTETEKNINLEYFRNGLGIKKSDNTIIVKNKEPSTRGNNLTDKENSDNKKGQLIQMKLQDYNFDQSDPFLATITNSQFLRLENDISKSGKEKLNNIPRLDKMDLNMINQNISSLGNQIGWQKSILRRMINDIDELNKAVVKATATLRNQPKGLSKQ